MTLKIPVHSTSDNGCHFKHVGHLYVDNTSQVDVLRGLVSARLLAPGAVRHCYLMGSLVRVHQTDEILFKIGDLT